MEETQIKMLQSLVSDAGGEYALNHCKRILDMVPRIAQDMEYSKDIMIFCAYTHDLGAFSPYTKDGINHAICSKEVVEAQILKEFSFTSKEQEIILETIECHHSSGHLSSNEAMMLRDADALDFIGFIGVARDFSRVNRDLPKGIQAIMRHRDSAIKNITLPSAKEIAQARIIETNTFLKQYENETKID